MVVCTTIYSIYNFFSPQPENCDEKEYSGQVARLEFFYSGASTSEARQRSTMAKRASVRSSLQTLRKGKGRLKVTRAGEFVYVIIGLRPIVGKFHHYQNIINNYWMRFL